MALQPQYRLERDYRGFETKTPITAKMPKKKPRNAQSTALRFFFFAVVKQKIQLAIQARTINSSISYLRFQ